MNKTQFALVAISIASAANPVIAQQSGNANSTTTESIERIVVTADFRSVTLEQLASSATVLDQTRLMQRQPQHLDALIGAIPNINFASGASRGRFVQIRGIGERSQFSEPLNPSVSFELDNIDLTGLFGLANPFDIAQVEVLRGPQATEFGVGALAGAIKMQGVMPGDEQDNIALMSYGTDDTWRLGAAMGHSLDRDLHVRASWIEQRSDGDIYNSFLNADDTNSINESAGRLALLSEISDDTSLLVNYRYFDIDNGYDAFSLDNDRQTRSDDPGFDRNETHAASVKLTTDNNTLQWQAILSATDSELAYGYDEDWTFTGFHPNGYTSFDGYFRDVSTLNAELRAISNQPFSFLGRDFDWVVGGIIRQRDEDLRREYTFAASDFTSRYEPSNTAFYTRIDTQFDNQLSLQFGLRVERSKLDYRDSTGFSETSSDTLVGGKLGLSLPISNGMLYSSISRGYKTGGFNPDERVTQQARLFEPEYNWNYEIGVKQSVWDQKGSIRVAAFYMNRENTQISDFDTLLRDNGSTDFIDVIANADVGTNYGLEFESNWALSDSWQIQVNLGYLDATFEQYTRADGSVVAKQDQAQAPKWTGNAISTLYLTDEIMWRVEFDVKDRHRFSDGHDVVSPGYALWHSSLAWQLPRVTLELWANNIFDRDYFVRGFGGFSNDPRDGEFGYEQPEPYYQFGLGRQVGITAQWHF
ncbi:TonB-dependent receptor [Alteromonas sp. ASW11-36]|uniref:TonB-dependent receptor n=1 Tax=Alteromonas arenosi TaxID=3055817 RepID=A0ABT7SV45_9ALTE|nr:TonB-dependent receptor [Alteromonas sp. ASW11-36]MDM7860056.1 TonB-dependent receptor [Alteromonas sp. ASW11-36]